MSEEKFYRLLTVLLLAVVVFNILIENRINKLLIELSGNNTEAISKIEDYLNMPKE